MKLTNEKELQRGLKMLQKIDKKLVPYIRGANDISLRWCRPGFHGFCQIIISQQLSKTSALAIMTRLEKILTPFTAKQCLALAPARLKRVGLTKAKLHTILVLANLIVAKKIDLDEIINMPAEMAMEKLQTIKGIGPWSAEIFLMFCGGAIDIFPAKDIALQQAIMDIDLAKSRPDFKQATEIAKRWQPVRSIAALVLWAIYARKKNAKKIAGNKFAGNKFANKFAGNKFAAINLRAINLPKK